MPADREWLLLDALQLKAELRELAGAASACGGWDAALPELWLLWGRMNELRELAGLPVMELPPSRAGRG